MAVLQLLLALLVKSTGRILNTVFGWATVMLFGKVPERRQYLLSAVAFAAMLWLVVAFGIAFPRLGAFLLAFIPLPEWVDDRWVRLTMLGLTVLLPLGVGGVGWFLTEPAQHPTTLRGKLTLLGKGYLHTVGLALTLVLMILAAPLIKVRDLIKRWTVAHVPMIVEAKNYGEVVEDIQRVLTAGGFATRQASASWLVRIPTRVFTFFAGGAIEKLVAQQLTVLKSGKIEVLLHPSDLVIRGRTDDVARIRALVSEHLTFTKAYQTWSKEANQLEDRLVYLWRTLHGASANGSRVDAVAELERIEKGMQTAKLSYEEWEVLFREKLTVECAWRRQTGDRPEQSPKHTHLRASADKSRK